MHPFSIERLTAPDTPDMVRQRLLYSRLVPGSRLDLQTPLSPVSPGVESTGSRDCSPETSFESLEQPPSDLPSPTRSEDSGRGSPDQLTEDLEPSPCSTPERPPDVSQYVKDPEKVEDTEKPPHSYIALISMAILGSKQKKLVLCDIYQYIMDKFPYYNNQERAWRNSIRHNLSLNECFIKAGRADNGKGNFWAIHPACADDFAKGDFRRRQARRRARAGVLEGLASAMPYGFRYQLPMGVPGYVPMTSNNMPSFPQYLPHLGYLPPHPACLPMLPQSYPQPALRLSDMPSHGTGPQLMKQFDASMQSHEAAPLMVPSFGLALPSMDACGPHATKQLSPSVPTHGRVGPQTMTQFSLGHSSAVPPYGLALPSTDACGPPVTKQLSPSIPTHGRVVPQTMTQFSLGHSSAPVSATTHINASTYPSQLSNPHNISDLTLAKDPKRASGSAVRYNPYNVPVRRW